MIVCHVQYGSLADDKLSPGKKLTESEHKQMVEFEADFFSDGNHSRG